MIVAFYLVDWCVLCWRLLGVTVRFVGWAMDGCFWFAFGCVVCLCFGTTCGVCVTWLIVLVIITSLPCLGCFVLLWFVTGFALCLVEFCGCYYAVVGL